MRTEDVVSITKNVIRKVAPHLPAIVVFALVEYVISRLSYKRSLAMVIAVPIILALVTEFLTQLSEGAVKERSMLPAKTVPPGD